LLTNTCGSITDGNLDSCEKKSMCSWYVAVTVDAAAVLGELATPDAVGWLDAPHADTVTAAAMTIPR
jgi:hypothetical protein